MPEHCWTCWGRIPRWDPSSLVFRSSTGNQMVSQAWEALLELGFRFIPFGDCYWICVLNILEQLGMECFDTVKLGSWTIPSQNNFNLGNMSVSTQCLGLSQVYALIILRVFFFDPKYGSHSKAILNSRHSLVLWPTSLPFNVIQIALLWLCCMLKGN